MNYERQPNYNDVHDREAAWRALAQSLYLRLSECRVIHIIEGQPEYPAPPTWDELEAFATRFRALSTAAGWTLKAQGTGTDELPMPKRPKRRKPWWRFW